MPHKKLAKQTAQETRDAAADLAKSAPNTKLRRFYAALVAERDAQLAAAAALAGPEPAAPAKPATPTK